MSELHEAFEKLDAAVGDKVGWVLRRTFNRYGCKAWRVDVGDLTDKVWGEGTTPELAVRGAMHIMLEQAQTQGMGKEEDARKARDETERLRNVLGL